MYSFFFVSDGQFFFEKKFYFDYFFVSTLQFVNGSSSSEDEDSYACIGNEFNVLSNMIGALFLGYTFFLNLGYTFFLNSGYSLLHLNWLNQPN